MKYIGEIAPNSYVKYNGWAPISEELIAIEAKLTDWKSGLRQAHRYKYFADFVYLAIPENKVHLIPKETLTTLNIGLVTIQNNDIVFVHKPKKSGNLQNEINKNFVLDYFWRYSIINNFR
jgi:hypothetical protein